MPSAIVILPANQKAFYSVYEHKKSGMGKRSHPNLSKRARQQEVKAPKTSMERKIRHRSRAEQIKARPVVRQGRLLDDERAWMDW